MGDLRKCNAGVVPVKGAGQGYPYKDRHFGNAENRKIVENAPEMSTDDSMTVLVGPYHRPRPPVTFCDTQSTLQDHHPVFLKPLFFFKKKQWFGIPLI